MPKRLDGKLPQALLSHTKQTNFRIYKNNHEKKNKHLIIIGLWLYRDISQTDCHPDFL